MSPPAGVVDGLLAGRYRLVARIGAGGNGEVWRARDERLDRDVAVKVLRPELADDEDVRARFRAEARHAGGLRHPGIAAVFDFAEGDDGTFLVMELVDGQPLSELLRRQGRLPVDRTLDVVEQAAAALQAAHDGGVVHRDVKPGNLLLRPNGRLSVTDFGIAHAAGAAALTRTGQVVGTASYLAPEQASGGPVSAATDLYALGVVAYECLAGARPFERDDPVAVLLAHLQTPPPPLPPDVPEPVADLVHRLLAKDPSDRPASGRQVQLEAAALRRGPVGAASPTAVLPVKAGPAAGPATVGTRPAALGLAGRPGQRRAVRATAVALGLLAVALGVRDATRDDPAGTVDLPERRPASSAPPTPAATQDAPVVQQQDEPARAPVQAPVQAPVDRPVQAPAEAPAARQGNGEGRQAEQQAEELDEREEQQAEQLDKREEQQRKGQDKQQEQQRKEQDKQAEKGRDQQDQDGKGRG